MILAIFSSRNLTFVEYRLILRPQNSKFKVSLNGMIKLVVIKVTIMTILGHTHQVVN